MVNVMNYNGGIFNLPFPIPTILLPVALNSLIFLYASINYYEDFLLSQSQYNDPSQVETYDFIVVGGGSAGSVVATRLAYDDFKVLLLEAGGDASPFSAYPELVLDVYGTEANDWKYETVPQKASCLGLTNHQSKWGRGKGLGGTSNLNFLIYQRGNPNDYNEWRHATGSSDWTYRKLIKYFKMSEDYDGIYPSDVHGSEGPMHVETLNPNLIGDVVLDAAEEKGYKIRDPNNFQTEGFNYVDVTAKNGQRHELYAAYITPMLNLKSENFKIYKFAQAIKINFDDDKRAKGVSYVRHGVLRTVEARKEVIVSGGTIDSPKLLMLSGIGPKEELKRLNIPQIAELPVGQNLQDHVSTLAGPFVIDQPSSGNTNSRNNSDHKFSSVQINGINSMGYIRSSMAKKDWPDIQLVFIYMPQMTQQVIDALTNKIGYKPGVLAQYFGPYIGKPVIQVAIFAGKAKSKGTVTLASSDPFSKPIIDPNYFSDSYDIKVLAEGMNFTIDFLENTSAFKKLNAKFANNKFPGCENHQARTTEYYECFARHFTNTYGHPIGTCAMGSSRSNNAVVDSQLRVLKVKNLRVIDASVFPTMTNGNPNAVAIMVAERGVDFIKKCWNSRRN